MTGALVLSLIVLAVVAVVCYIIQEYLPVEPKLKNLIQLVVVVLGIIVIILRIAGVS